MKFLIVILIIVLGGFSYFIFNESANNKCKNAKPITVLFIGNSFTFYNNLPKLFADTACSTGIKVEYDSATIAGGKFSNHAFNQETLSKINSKKWNYVILQEQSQTAGFKPIDIESKSLSYAKILVDQIQRNNESTEIIYYATWGKLGGDQENCEYYSKLCTFEGSTNAVENGYLMYQNLTGGKIAFVGRVWQKTINPNSKIQTSALFHADGSHPSLKGSYLASLVLTSTIFGQNIMGAKYPEGINKNEAIILQELASN